MAKPCFLPDRIPAGGRQTQYVSGKNHFVKASVHFMVNLQSYPRRKEQIIAQSASNDLLLLNMQDGNYYSLNEVSRRIWDLCDGNHSVAQVIEILVGEYDVPAETLITDVLELVAELQNGELIVEATPAA